MVLSIRDLGPNPGCSLLQFVMFVDSCFGSLTTKGAVNALNTSTRFSAGGLLSVLKIASAETLLEPFHFVAKCKQNH